MEITSTRKLTVVIVGLGLMGKERLKAIRSLQQKNFPCECIGVYDPFAENSDASDTTKFFASKEAIVDAQPDWVIVATPHDVAVELTQFFLSHRIKVLIEKPLGRSSIEAKLLITAQQFPQQLFVGFNYRFFECIQKAYQDIRNNYFGKLIAITMTLGHGGRPGDENTWKLNPEKCGGGCLLDPGIHLLDLIRQFSHSTLVCKSGAAWQGFWNTGIEEEAHLILQNHHTVFNVSVSNLRWRNTFRIEIHGTDHYGIIHGRNRSYGQQTYLRGPRWGWKNAIDQAAAEKILLTSDGESSFENELQQLFFHTASSTGMKPCSAEDAYQTMLLWEQCKQQLTLE